MRHLDDDEKCLGMLTTSLSYSLVLSTGTTWKSSSSSTSPDTPPAPRACFILVISLKGNRWTCYLYISINVKNSFKKLEILQISFQLRNQTKLINYVTHWTKESHTSCAFTFHHCCCHPSHCHSPLQLPVMVLPFPPLAEQLLAAPPPPLCLPQLSSFCLFLEVRIHTRIATSPSQTQFHLKLWKITCMWTCECEDMNTRRRNTSHLTV